MKQIIKLVFLMCVITTVVTGCSYTRGEYIGNSDELLGEAIGERILGELNCFRGSALTNARTRNDEASKVAESIVRPMQDNRYWYTTKITDHSKVEEGSSTIEKYTETTTKIDHDVIVQKAMNSIDHIHYAPSVKRKIVHLILSGKDIASNEYLYFRGLYNTLKY